MITIKESNVQQKRTEANRLVERYGENGEMVVLSKKGREGQ